MGEQLPVLVLDLGHLAYEPAYEAQTRHVEEVLAARASDAAPPGRGGRILLVEHSPPVITVSKRPSATSNLVATPEQLAAQGVVIAQTDRGGDITYHGPGQLVVYPIIDLNYFRLGLHDYMRLLEAAVIEACGRFGVPAHRDACATGVWVGGTADAAASCAGTGGGGGGGAGSAAGGAAGGVAGGVAGGAKICAMGVRVRRWITMHGLALNVTTNLDHFGLIVPCGLPRPVTSLQRELGDRCPPMAEVKRVLPLVLLEHLRRARELAVNKQAAGGGPPAA